MIYPFHRPCPFSASESLSAAWHRSQETLNAIHAALAELPDPRVVTIAASGSLGRMEQVETSDADLIVVTRERLSREASDALLEEVWQRLTEVAIPRPGRASIFWRTSFIDELMTAEGRDRVAEDLVVFGHRIQILLDSQPVYNAQAFGELQRGVLQRYTEGCVPWWEYLQKDLQRYFHSLCVRYLWQAKDDPPVWCLRAAKLRHNRLAMYLGLLYSLGHLSRSIQAKPVPLLQPLLARTPLERMVFVAEASHAEAAAEEFQACLNSFLQLLTDEKLIAALNRAASCTPDENAAYAKFYESARRFSRANLKFLVARLNDWDQQFVESLLLV